MPFSRPKPARKKSGFLCCGKKAIQQSGEQSGDDEERAPLPSSPASASSPSARTSKGQSSVATSAASAVLEELGDEGKFSPLEDEWKIGGRYKVLRAVPLYEEPTTASRKVGMLRLKEMVLLCEVASVGASEAGLVMPVGDKPPGWVFFEDEAHCPLERRRQLDGSWEMKARYMVKHPATLREDADMGSAELVDVSPGEEVLVLELAVGKVGQVQPGKKNLRLRMQVRTDDGKIGWISPETASGERLLYPINLLGPRVVELHRLTMSGGNPGAVRSSVRQSQSAGLGLPWQAGGKYRVLEKVALRQSLDLASPEVGAVSAGCIVMVSEVKMSSCPDMGLCPSANVVVSSGPEEGQSGWLRCAHKDGHDLIDSRDQLESDKVVRQLRMSQGIPAPHKWKDCVDADGFHTGDVRLEEPPRESDEESGSSESTAGTRDEDAKDMKFPEAPGAARGHSHEADDETPGLLPLEKANKMFEEAIEDAIAGEPTIVEDRSYNCCSCTVRRRAE